MPKQGTAKPSPRRAAIRRIYKELEASIAKETEPASDFPLRAAAPLRPELLMTKKAVARMRL